MELITPKPEKKKAPKINSRKKGSVGELEWANLLKSYGIQARRGQQFRGTKDSPDVETELEHLHFEVKRVEKLNISKAMIQAQEECGEDQTPIIAHRKNDEDWMITMFAEDFIEDYLVEEEE